MDLRQTVVLTVDLPASGLSSGAVGRIAHVLRSPSEPLYEVDFTTADGRTVTAVALTGAEIRPHTDPVRATITVMADYECFPLWSSDPATPRNLDPAALPLSPTLVDRLLAWAAEFDVTLDHHDPTRSGFPTEEHQDRFHRRGEQLAAELARQLAGRYTVRYWDPRCGDARTVGG
jgi:hypothetical protein